ncbi:MAG TPA: GNAT family protein [Isosphaeraceae bacterium]|jgi:RimJ/RimL family protein N-acetyltransferase|nr:GNAT family protein [Isosphaeraceae bacterium]
MLPHASEPMVVRPVVLEGRHVRLEPLTLDHHARLCEVGLDEEIWRWYLAPVLTPQEMMGYIATALAEQSAGVSLPFVTIDRASGRVVGGTSYLNIAAPHRRLEIGSTWIAPPWQRTAINTEAKLLMLGHAFEVLGCVRVEFKTDSLNDRSRAAILRLGATEEGTHRNHMITATGRLRHSVYFSIIDSEWPTIRAALLEKLS